MMTTSSFYRVLAELPTPVQASFLHSKDPHIHQIHAKFSINDQARNEKRSIAQAFTIAAGRTDSPTILESPVQDATDVLLSATSPSGKFQALLREAKYKRFVEIWTVSGATPIASLDVTDTHEGFYADDEYASLSFSAGETALVYTAEAKRPTSSENAWSHFRYRPTLGEGYKGKRQPTLFLFRWGSKSPPTTSALQLCLPAAVEVLFGQAQFSPVDENVLYATGYEYMSDGRLLGVKFCLNRPSKVYELTLSGMGVVNVKQLSSSDLTARSPRISPDGKVIWLSHKLGGAHAGTSKLERLGADGVVKTLVDIVEEPSVKGDFPGLYCGVTLPRTPFVNDGKAIIASSLWGSRLTAIYISLEDGTVQDLLPDKTGQAWNVLSTDGNKRILCAASTVNSPTILALLELDESANVSRSVNLSEPHLPLEVKDALSGLRSETLSIPGRHPTETIVVHPPTGEEKKSVTPPCVISPHGGPHGTFTSGFSPAIACLALEGYTISLPNYTGSLGFGEKYVRALQGQCGTLDVLDCIASVHHLIKLGIAEEGEGRLFLMGGSHGGFLTAHLIGQYPDMFTAAVIRNPVISAGDVANTDIPDWYYSEFGFEEEWPLLPHASGEPAPPPKRLTGKMFDKLESMSPMSYIDNVRADVLLHMGGSDKRVSPAQGLAFYHALEGRSVNVDMLWFEDQGHSLDGVEAARVVWETTRDFLNQRRK